MKKMMVKYFYQQKMTIASLYRSVAENAILTVDSLRLKINEPCAVVWEYKGKLNWFIGFVLTVCEKVRVEHLERLVTTNDNAWQYPSLYTDTHDVDKEQILPVAVESEWDCSDPENSILYVKNEKEIKACFAEFV